MNHAPRGAVCLAALLAVALGPAFSARAQPLWTEGSGRPVAEDTPLTSGTFKRLAERLSPAVVYLEVRKRLHTGGGTPLQQWYEFFHRVPQQEGTGAGTGFIIHPDGLILTNNHVVEGATQITVKLPDDREVEGRLLGADPATDIALVSIEAKGLEVAPLADSSRLEVGDWVMAIGNPFGLSHTVTTGIVSALGRQEVMPDERLAYRDFIQTDASINPGNSGGPLVNLAGEVVGINAVIVGQANVGVAFAIPINMAKAIIPALKEFGRPQRSWIGIKIQPVTPALADALGLDRSAGAIVNEVVPGGPGDRAGLQERDVIVEFDGKPIERTGDLPWLASIAGVGKEVGVLVKRGGKSKRLRIRLEELPEPGAARTPTRQPGPKTPDAAGGMGLVVAAVPAELAKAHGLKAGVGVLVTDVDQGSPAMRAGLRPNDVVVELQGKPVRGVREFVRTVRAIQRGAAVKMVVRRGRGQAFVAIRKP